MKVPLEHEPFAPVVLTGDQERQLQWLSDALLEETLVQNDDFVHRKNRVLDKTKWKQVISRENVVIYKRHGKGEQGTSTPDIDLFDPHAQPRTRSWRLPMSVGVGTLTGTLDDLLYGVLAPSTLEYKVRTSYTKDDIADTRQLATILKPTESDPMRLMVVRWTLMKQLIHSLGIAPRDVVHLDSMGTRILPSGERIGYIIHHSLDLPGCGELTHLGFLRSTYSACFVFRDTGYGAIELYMRATVDPGGKLSDSLGVFFGSLALISVWRMMFAGQNKKLAYMARTSMASHQARPPDVTAKGKATVIKNCPLCSRSLSGFRTHARCDLCQTTMCSRCVEKRKLTHIRCDGKLVRVATRICKACLTMATKMNASDIAALEHLPDTDRTIRLWTGDETSSTSSSRSDSLLHQPPNLLAWLNRDSSFSRHSSDTITSDSTAPRRGPRSTAYSNASSISLLDDSFSLPSTSDLRTTSESVDQSQLELWARLNQLRVATEETYLMAKRAVPVDSEDTLSHSADSSTNTVAGLHDRTSSLQCTQ